MKRILSMLLLCALLCVFLAACGDKEPERSYTLTKFSVNGVEYSASEINTLGIEGDIRIFFSEDHTGSLSFAGQESEFSWDDSYLTSEGERIPYRMEDGKLILDIQDATLIFE